MYKCLTSKSRSTSIQNQQWDNLQFRLAEASIIYYVPVALCESSHIDNFSSLRSRLQAEIQSTKFNDSGSCDILIRDETHRLKNDHTPTKKGTGRPVLQTMLFIVQMQCMTRSSTKELLSPFENPKQKFHSSRRLFDTPSLAESNSPEFDHIFDIEEQLEEEELRDNTFSGSEHEDANEHIKKVLEIVDLFHILKKNQDQIMLQAFPVSFSRAVSRWLRNQPSGSITTWEVLKTKFLNKYCPPTCTAKKVEETNSFQQEPDESLFHAWERFKELLMKCLQHYLTEM
ncbi:retrotransposon protein [Tanacetum coccineum]